MKIQKKKLQKQDNPKKIVKKNGHAKLIMQFKQCFTFIPVFSRLGVAHLLKLIFSIDVFIIYE